LSFSIAPLQEEDDVLFEALFEEYAQSCDLSGNLGFKPLCFKKGSSQP